MNKLYLEPCLFLYFDIGSREVDQDDLELAILLPQPSKLLGYRRIPPRSCVFIILLLPLLFPEYVGAKPISFSPLQRKNSGDQQDKGTLLELGRTGDSCTSKSFRNTYSHTHS